MTISGTNQRSRKPIVGEEGASGLAFLWSVSYVLSVMVCLFLVSFVAYDVNVAIPGHLYYLCTISIKCHWE